MIKNVMMPNIPSSEIINKYSAINSNKYSRFLFSVLIEIKERIEEIVKNKATNEVNSSIELFSDLLVMCKEVIINKQKPNRFADVPNICCEVLLAIFFSTFYFWVFINVFRGSEKLQSSAVCEKTAVNYFQI